MWMNKINLLFIFKSLPYKKANTYRNGNDSY